MCSTGTAPTHLQCLDLAVSDHYAVLFTVLVPVPKQHISRNRNIITVNTLALTNILETHLASDPVDTSLDGLVAHYNAAVSWGLDSLAPLKTQIVSFTHSAPWFAIELCTLKTTGRLLERFYKRSGLTVLHEACKDHVRSDKEALPRPKETTTPPSLETCKITPECSSPPLTGSLAISMSPSFLVSLISASGSWTYSRERWLPFTSNSWHLPPPYHYTSDTDN